MGVPASGGRAIQGSAQPRFIAPFASPLARSLCNGFAAFPIPNARNENRINRRPLPANTDCIVMLTSFLNHNTMKKIKTEAKKRDIPLVCAKRSVSCVFCEYCKVFKLNKEFGCDTCE